MADFPAQSLADGALAPVHGSPAPAGATSFTGIVLIQGLLVDIPTQALMNIPVPDVTDPMITNQDPAPGSALSPGSTVNFDVTDNEGLLFVEIQVDHGSREVVHDGDTFVDPYLASTRVPITDGYRYQVRRTGGWQTGPTFRVRVFDTSGNEAT